MKYVCLDCTIREVTNASNTDQSMLKYFYSLERFRLEDRCAHYNPEFWIGDEYWQGYTRNWGDASVGESHGSKNFEVLRKEKDGKTEFLILCPTELRRPLRIEGYGNAWGSY